MSDINELFRKDPLSCTKIDIQEIVKAFREKRAQYQLGSKMAGKVTAPKLTAKDIENAKAVDLSNLNLDI